MAEPDRKSARRRPPITRHPLFPAIAALWSAALLGVASFALPPALLESAVLATGLDGVVPAAAPPLGMTARLLLALMLGGVGGLVGLLLARRAAGNVKPRPQVLNVADVDDGLPWTGMVAAPPSPRRQVELDDDVFDVAPPAPAPVRAAPEPEPQPEPEPVSAPAPTAAQRIAAAELDELSHVELVERLAIAIQRRQERRTAGDAEPAGPVVRFPGLADRQGSRLAPPAPEPLPAPHETEKALREALAKLQRMSGGV